MDLSIKFISVHMSYTSFYLLLFHLPLLCTMTHPEMRNLLIPWSCCSREHRAYLTMLVKACWPTIWPTSALVRSSTRKKENHFLNIGVAIVEKCLDLTQHFRSTSGVTLVKGLTSATYVATASQPRETLRSTSRGTLPNFPTSR